MASHSVSHRVPIAHFHDLRETADRAGRRLRSVRRRLLRARATPSVHAAHRSFGGGLRLMTLAAVTGAFVTLL